MSNETVPQIRIDKFLWHARFFKTRGLATKLVAGGHVRVNSDRTTKPARVIHIGDVLTFPQGDWVRVIKVAEVSTRRGPAPESQALYEDLSPDPPPKQNYVPPAPGFDGKGRPGKKERKNRRLSDRAAGDGTGLE